MILTIKAVEDKGNYKLATAANGRKYSVWPEVKGDPNPAYGLVKGNTTLDCDVLDSPDGKFHNIVNAKPAQAAPAAQHRPQAEQGGYVDAEIIKRASIEAQTAYNGIIALAVAGKCPPKDLDRALDWATMRLCPAVDPNEVPF